ncbi:phosphofructokinase family protein, putative [Ichthyophthirius multifiliis]|uniref:Phosphofructokinase family protein, putative n=1 Tax=Ichthyophthirius multifiliis TaxID=5932 RepID=G0QWG7_ICHMU|nr:phosphofructokinase family protein, putative [Ichthyophthirius multifiliis]EGR30438.1 phosphofructokinase family protein, putative [Ichthyophthirius multifiliis]|eukprot:XP_004032025.1 phosphofructokinase family protein, putative [Ichthyophthirius multifiliis]
MLIMLTFALQLVKILYMVQQLYLLDFKQGMPIIEQTKKRKIFCYIPLENMLIGNVRNRITSSNGDWQKLLASTSQPLFRY